MAKVLREGVRDIDLPARYGGEELIVILPNAGLATAARDCGTHPAFGCGMPHLPPLDRRSAARHHHLDRGGAVPGRRIDGRSDRALRPRALSGQEDRAQPGRHRERTCGPSSRRRANPPDSLRMNQRARFRVQRLEPLASMNQAVQRPWNCWAFCRCGMGSDDGPGQNGRGSRHWNSGARPGRSSGGEMPGLQLPFMYVRLGLSHRAISALLIEKIGVGRYAQ